MDSDRNLVALEGEEIGQLLAQSVQGGVAKKEPWYEPSNGTPSDPLITNIRKADFDTVIVDSQMVIDEDPDVLHKNSKLSVIQTSRV
jgi:hypothetical protein